LCFFLQRYIIYYMIGNKIVEEIVLKMKNGFADSNNFFSETRDVFTARIQSYVLSTKKYLESAVIGEIGNNTFDHNFIFDDNYTRGVYCNLSYDRYIILVDYGRGIKQSLIPVIPAINSDIEALEIAFTKQVSGRSPEQRGNGLKFVSETIRQNKWHLFFQSGNASCSIDKNGVIFNEEITSLIGCLAILDFNEGD